jgi:hypothetical protein
MVLGCVVLSLGWLTWCPVAIGRAEGWKACAFNDQSIGWRDTHSPDGTVRIVWQERATVFSPLICARAAIW